MKKWLLFMVLPLFVYAFKVEKMRTELYSKTGANTLKKVELSLEFEGENLLSNKDKLLDSTNIVISGFFYEDLFTELGKMRFKETLVKFINKKYQLGVKNIYILSLKGVEKFDIEELKAFLEDNFDTKKEVQEIIKEKNLSIEVPKIAPLPSINSILDGAPNDTSVDDINIDSLQVPTLPQSLSPQPIQLKDKNATGFDINASR